MIEETERPLPIPPPPPPAPRRDAPPDSLLSLVIIVCGLLYLVSICNVGLDLGGNSIEGISIHSARRLRGGEILYRDFSAPYGPGRYYLLDFASRITGAAGPPWTPLSSTGWSDLIAARLFWSALVALTAGVAYLVCRAMMSPLLAFVCAILFVLLHPPLAQVYPALFIAITALLLQADRTHSSPDWAAWIGLVVGVAFLFREAAGAATLGAALVVFLFRALADGAGASRSPWWKIPALLGGALMPIIGAQVLFAFRIPFHFDYNIGRLPLGRLLDGSVPPIERAALFAVPLLYLTTGAWIVGRSLARGRRRGDAAALGLATAGIVTCIAFLHRADIGSLLTILLPALILAFRLLSIFSRRACRFLLEERLRPMGLASIVVHSALIVLITFFLAAFSLHRLLAREDGRLRVFTGARTFRANYRGTSLRLNQSEAARMRPAYLYFHAEIYPAHPRTGHVHPVDFADFQRARRVFCLPAGGLWYPYLNAGNPTSYEFTHAMSEEDQDRLIRQLEGVDYILYDTSAMQGLGPDSFARRFPLVDRYIFIHFRIERNANGLLILKRVRSGKAIYARTNHDHRHRTGRRRLPAPGPAEATA